MHCPIAISTILRCYTFNVALTWRIQIGPLNEKITHFISFCDQWCKMNQFLGFNEIMIYKILVICSWNHICYLDEDFWAKFILRFNFGLTLSTQLLLWMLGNSENTQNGVFNGSFQGKHTSVFWPIITFLTVLLLPICGIITIYHKYKIRNDVISINLNPEFNNVKLNKPMINGISVVVLSMINIGMVITIYFLLSSSDFFIKSKYLLYINVIFQFPLYIFIPIVVLLRKTTFRTFLWREIKDWVSC